MAAEIQPNYRRLPGTGYRHMVPSWALVLLFFVIGIFVLLLRGRRVQLWLGDDHLLLVEWDGAKEYYKRFRYGDIQSFVIRPTAEGRIVNGVLGAVVAFFGLLAYNAYIDSGWIFLFFVAGFFALLLLGNALSGPTCQCQIRTAVQVEDLPSLNRLRHALRAVEELRPRIATVQGEMTPQDFNTRLYRLAQSAATEAGYPAPAVPAADNLGTSQGTSL